ncbi:nonribosomal peptide synthetase [Streptomyces lincolnensis]|uniref:Phenyloxazoline synthase MbtB n=1 Tax=Streptomyces lincolnensis TaxID=1915 RepID=A0A1B1M4J0_STRLN|nr:non-ribosomal peptide synthetase [Streptomyces lincolnensis]ANS63555.1 nonribosomal peptide synthetase [Streptomyces lincolnensis]AXG52477.1 nonribosomal peptide synthetase [Streptomyces lincolnensis]QMV05433.1 non-ribosomal peptide synthetase [Streptomyces lincolnensis]
MSEPDLLRTVRPLLADWFGPDADRIGSDDNLIEQGLDSIRLMSVSAALRGVGIRLTFAELARTPTLRAWEALLAERCPSIGAPGTTTPDAPSPAAAEDDEPTPFDLALMQHAYWVGRGKEHELGGVAAHFYNEFDGEDVDPQRLERAVRALLARHAQLRAVFRDDGRQYTPAASSWPGLRVHDLRALPEEEAQRRLEKLRDELSHRMLRVGTGEVFDVQLSLLPDGRTRTHLNLDMLAADALSLRVLLADLAVLYQETRENREDRGAERLPPIGYSYRRYLADRAVSAERERDRRRDAAWWAERLPDLPGAPALPVVQGTDRPRVTRRHHWLAPEARDALFARAHRHGVTPAMALATAYGEVLAAWSAEHRFLLNVPLFDREELHPDVPLLVGDFTGSVLLTADLSGQDVFQTRARTLQERFLADAAHASYSGVEVLRDLNRAQRGDGRVLAPVVFTSALNLGELFSEDVRACFGRPVWIISQGPQVWLDAQVTELDGGLLVNWDALEQAFPEAMLDAMFTAFRTLVDELSASDTPWDTPASDLLPEAQREARARANATDGPRSGLLLHEDFLRHAEQTPDRPALLWGAGDVLSYGELADRARRIAAALAAHAVGPGDRVAVCLPKGPDQIAAVLGVLTAGAAYVPVGRDHPPARRDRVLTRAGARVALVAGAPGSPLPDGVVPLTVPDALVHEPVKEPVAVPDGDPAYILFTSGSTGEPKGVVVPHRAARNTVDDLDERFGVGGEDRTLALSALDFDLSVYDLFGPLTVGGAVVLVAEEDRRDAARWHALMARHRVTVLNCVPSALDMLLSTSGDGLAGLRLVLLGGDWVGVDLPGRLADRSPGCRFVALGGTTETAIHSTVCEVVGGTVPEDWTAVPYGTPLRNVRLRVVDARGRDCPDWVPGELWIGGDGVADGYLGDPERTADRFVHHDGVRWYRTGDLARYRPGGTVEFLGRADSQVKLRGHRVELGEVEAALERAPGVGRAVAAVTGGADGAPRSLVAAYSLASGAGAGRHDGVLPQVVASRPDPLETEVVAHVIGRILAGGTRPAEDMRGLAHLWRDWLLGRSGPADGDSLTERVTGTRLAPVLDRLTERLPDLRAMLTGDRDPLELLDDPVLAPEAALDALPGSGEAAAECADALRALAARADGRVLRVAVVGARGGRGVQRIVEQLPDDSVRFTLFDASAGLLERARERLTGVDCQVLRDGVLPEGVPGTYDAVLALGALHAFDDPAAGVAQAAALLAPGGLLLAVEQGSLPPLGLICAALPTRGFANADPARRAAGSPLLPPSAWEQLLRGHGFTQVDTAVRGQEPALLMRAVRDPEGALCATDSVRAFLAGQVPSYMVPDRLVLLPVLPLTANGKVDRRAVRALLDRQVRSGSHRPGQGTPPRPGAEELVAEVWRELLGARAVHREDDFFALGGDSLLATRMLHRLGERGARGARIADLFTHPALKDYAATLALGGESTEHTGQPATPVLMADPDHAHAPFPATDVQRAYWLGRAEEMRLGGVGAHYYSEFDGSDVDLPRLEQAWRGLIARHPMLRAVFDEDGHQRVLTEAETPDFTIPVRDGEEHLTALREEMSHQVLDPARWPLFDVRAVRYGDGGDARTRIGVSLDNLVLDGLSMMTVFTELGVLYADPGAELPPVEPTFRDYLASVRPAPETLAADQAYWRDRLPELPPAPRLPLLRDPAALGRPRFTRTSGELAADRWRRLKERAREHGVTPSTLLLAAYTEVLGTWSESPELTVNLTLFDRQEIHPDINRVMGDFTSLLLAAHRPRPGEDWLTRVRGLQEQLWRDLDHRSVSAVWVMRELARTRGQRDAAVPVVFTSALGVDDGVSMDAPAGFPPRVWGVSQTPQVWLDLQVYEGRDGALRHQWDAVRELFPNGLVETLSAAFDKLLRHLSDADWRLPRPALLPDAQRTVRDRVNATGRPDGRRVLHTPFFEQAAADPAAPALLWGEDGALTRGELRERALRIAAALRGRGVAPGDTVAVSLPKGPEQITAVLGVLAAGAAYVPVGADQPPVRRDRMLSASRARCVLDAEFLSGPLPAPLATPVAAAPDSCAYVIFTSGSTGEPKGVELTHRAAANTVEDINARHGIGPGDRVLAVSALDFDLSVYDVFGLLGAGGALVLVTEEERRDAQRWRDLAARHGVTVWNSVPMLLDMLLTASAGQAPPELRLALVSGDWVPLDLPARLAEASGGRCRLIAMGGATEAAIWSNAYDSTDGAPEGWPSVPYGTPLRGQLFRVVGPLGEDCPDWVPGELWIGGAGVATGYRGDPERTADRFVTDGGERWYRTGDLGRYRPDGLLEFLGRRDHQLKIRGHRTELGEVDAALLAQPGVGRAVTVATGPRGQQRLTAFLIPESPSALLDLSEIERRLADHLPAHAVPSALVPLPDGLPLTANGKVDRAALTEHAAGLGVVSGGTRQPTGPLEDLVAAAWRELLEAEQVGRDDEFFALGGDSLLATRLVARLREAGVRGARIAALFTHPVLKDYAATLTLDGEKPATQVLVSDPAHAHDPFPATDVQRAYWIGRTAQLDLGGVGSHYYSETDEPYTEVTALERAWRRLIARHPMLRAVFDEDGHQRVLTEAGIPDFTIPVRDGEEHLTALRDEMSHQVLDPARWPLFDVRAVHYTAADGERRTRIGVSLDNLVLDGLSMMIVFTELRQLRENPDTELPPVDATFRDYLASARPSDVAVTADREYWRERLPSLPSAPRLPLLREPSEVGRPRFVRRATHLPYAPWRRLKERVRDYGLTPSVLLLAVYAEALGEHTDSPELTVNLTLFDRQEIHPHVSRIAGDFTSLLLAAHHPRAGESWLTRLRGLQARLWTDLDHRAVSAVWVMRQLAQERGADGAAMPVVFTSALGIDDERARLLTPPHWSVSQTPQVWLDHQVLEDAEGLRLTWDAVTGLLPDDLPGSLMDRQLALLDELSTADDWDALILATGLRAGERSAAPVTTVKADAGGPPLGATEELVAALWSELLPDSPPAGREQGFFAAGGDSLLATRLIARLRERTGVEVPLREFFTAPTVAALAAAADDHTDRTTDQNWEEGEL